MSKGTIGLLSGAVPIPLPLFFFSFFFKILFYNIAGATLLKQQIFTIFTMVRSVKCLYVKIK